MRYQTPFVHAFETENHKYLYDVNTNRVLRVNEVIYDLIRYYGRLSPEEIAQRLNHKYDIQTIKHGLKEIETAQKLGLFSTFRPSKIQYPKTRTEIRDLLDTERGSITLNVTEDCNMRCRYCIYSGSYKGMRKHNKKYMSFQTAKKAIDQLLEHSFDRRKNKQINIGFYGGEPLLNFKLIRESIEYVESRIDPDLITYNITTNGTVLNDRIIDFLIAHDVNLLVSLDGPKHRHDRYRVFPDGRGSFDIVVRNLMRIRDRNPDYFRFKVNFSVVIAPPVDYMEVDRFFSSGEVGVHQNIMATTPSPGSDFLKQFPPEELYDPAGEEKLWRKYVDGLLEHITEDPLYIWDYALARSMFAPVLLSIYDCQPYEKLPEVYHPGGICIPGHRKMLVTADGLYYVCERVYCSGNKDDLYCIGDVENGINYEKVFRLIEEYSSLTELDCCRCWALRLCQVCFSALTPIEEDVRMDPGEKRAVCREARELVHQALIRFYSVLEKDPTAFDFMDNMERIRD
ncbi:radical SAM protein [Candidatus Poribacteria bacterium]|nr:radical SAM protein [Candidatus Poribacteria bacterium]